MYPEVRRLLRIWQNNYIVISPKTDAHILSSNFPRTSPAVVPLTLFTNFSLTLFVCEKLEWGWGEICNGKAQQVDWLWLQYA